MTARRRAAALHGWYEANRRDLPWRDCGDPYRVLVSEVMLQQTQASRVVPYYERFIAAFPTVGRLAAAELSEVLAVWAGLGYNNRAVRLQAAARRVAGGGWPNTIEGLRALPGVGPYTAAALASFAFGRRVAAPDTNARRVLSRWLGTPVAGTALAAAAAAELAASPATAADWNQAVMELGAQVCRPRSPDCAACPVAKWCAGPDAYRPPPRQSQFAGSVRQTRGAVVRALLADPGLTSEQLIARLGHDAATMRRALAGLASDGLVATDGDHYRLG